MARRCRNCPDAPKPEPAPKATEMPVLAAEAEKLWHQAFYSANGTLEMMAGYVMVGVPGNPTPRMRKLAARLNEIIKTCEERDGSETSSLGEEDMRLR